MSESSPWEVYGLQGNPYTTSPLAEGGAIPIQEAFIGRKMELELLAHAMTVDQRGCVFISGDVGVGKTSLMNFHKHLFRSREGASFLSPRRELEASVDTMSKRGFLLEVICAMFSEIKLLDPDIAARDPFLQKIAALVDFVSLVELTTSTSIHVGIASLDATESRGLAQPMHLTITRLEQYMLELIAWVRKQKIAGNAYDGIIIHVNNFDVVLQSDPKGVRIFLDELRDTLQTPHLYVFFLGPANFYEDMVSGNQRLRPICSSPLFLQPLSKSDLTAAIERRYRFLRSSDGVGFIKPLSDQIISLFYDMFDGDVRSALGACSDLVQSNGGRISRTIDSDEAIVILGKLKWKEAEIRGINTKELQAVMSYIASKKEGATAKEIARALDKDPANISGYYLPPLRIAGIVAEGVRPEDQRLKCWKLSREFSPLYYYKDALQTLEKRLRRENFAVQTRMF